MFAKRNGPRMAAISRSCVASTVSSDWNSRSVKSSIKHPVSSATFASRRQAIASHLPIIRCTQTMQDSSRWSIETGTARHCPTTAGCHSMGLRGPKTDRKSGLVEPRDINAAGIYAVTPDGQLRSVIAGPTRYKVLDIASNGRVLVSHDRDDRVVEGLMADRATPVVPRKQPLRDTQISRLVIGSGVGASFASERWVREW
jgi:hypothetical protein